MPFFCCGQQPVDSDGDGLSDMLEQALLVQFVPTFMVGKADCFGVPAEFQPGSQTPVVKAENGTIYGQVSPAGDSGHGRAVEIRFYHLWRADCGRHGHSLDTEHVAVLVHADRADLARATWKAGYWYAAAHEKTVCDVSQVARASTLGAVNGGAKVWISPGKHASYLNETLCERGCGADRCTEMTAMRRTIPINLGEPGRPMNDALFISSNRWPLAEKMAEVNFTRDALARVEHLRATDIAWANAGRHPAQGVIAISSHTEAALARGEGDTASAMSVAGDSTGGAISTAGESTGNALGKSYRKTVHALGSSVKHVGKALGLSEKTAKTE